MSQKFSTNEQVDVFNAAVLFIRNGHEKIYSSSYTKTAKQDGVKVVVEAKLLRTFSGGEIVDQSWQFMVLISKGIFMSGDNFRYKIRFFSDSGAMEPTYRQELPVPRLFKSPFGLEFNGNRDALLNWVRHIIECEGDMPCS